MKDLYNPFVISGYEGAHYFCDRQEEIAQLAREIANGNNVALIGFKTILSKRFHYALGEHRH